MLAHRAWLCLPVLLALSGAAQGGEDETFTPEEKGHWAWKAPVRPPVPRVRGAGWVRNPVDVFVAARREAAGLPPAAPAGREQLIRRATFALIGLPPTPQEIDAFVEDPSPDAWEKAIDRLLSSPAYGERWGRHWLDLARFAESNGFEFDEARPDAWRYRDYVIRAFNEDSPYDRFALEQLAADELFPGDREALVATGFNLLGPDMTDAADQAERRQNTLNDMTDTAALVFLGLTVGCARCHDHKFEPISQRDYYRLQAFFTPAQFRLDLPIAADAERAAHEKALGRYNERVAPLREAVARLEAPARQKLYEQKLARLSDDARAAHRTPAARRTAAQKETVAKTARLLVVNPLEVLRALGKEDAARHRELQEQLRAFDSLRPAPLPVAMGLRDGPAARTFVLERGARGSPGDEVRPGFPAILLPGHKEAPATGRRAALARWVAARDNPLTARVLVNRLWQHHFGRGLVPTPSDFGTRGDRPTHPELLDWLAVEFMESGWSVKRMHRLLLTSATYVQSSRAAPGVRTRDPDNALLARKGLVRLEGEIIRDALLALGGRLDRRMGGPGVFPPLPAEMAKGFTGWKASPDPRDHGRRSVYVFARRNLRFPFLEAFDAPDSNLSCPKRERSTTAPQALALLNAEDVAAAARGLAARLERAAGSADERIALAYRLVLGRRPTGEESALAREFLSSSPLSEFCRALFNLNEFVYPE